MSWKDDLKEIQSELLSIKHWTHHTKLDVTDLKEQFASVEKKLNILNAGVVALLKSKNQAVDKMADKFIELAMVSTGDSRAAASHRRAQMDEVPEEASDLWQENAETEWPPKGCDAITMP